MFEELNRCPRYMATPCLQMLTTRQLNDYVLPAGWLPCAAVNDATDGYLTDELDTALLARFLRVKVIPDMRTWLLWAEAHDIHRSITEFVQDSPDVFDEPEANPRAWTYASRLLVAWEKGHRELSLLATALAGVVGEKWALAFLETYSKTSRPLQPHEIIAAYRMHRSSLKRWLHQGHLDIVAASLERLKRHIQPQPVYDAIVRNASEKAHVALFLMDLPADLKLQMHNWLRERGFTELAQAICS